MISTRQLRRLSLADLKYAIALKRPLEKVERLERQREKHLMAAKRLQRRIDRLTNGTSRAAPEGVKRRRRRMSAETRRKMSEAAKARWAKVRKAEKRIHTPTECLSRCRRTRAFNTDMANGFSM